MYIYNNMCYCNKIEFFYTKQSLANSFQRVNAVALNATDNTQAYTVAGNTRPWVVYNGVGSYSELNLFYQVRQKADSVISTIVYNFVSEYGNLSFTIVIPTLFFEKGKIYETFATYRDGIFASTPVPRVVTRILDDPNETRIWTVYF